jgi:hypothetical protein
VARARHIWWWLPGASTSTVGRKVTFTGTDTLRIVNGKIAEYWANADSLLFVQQLGLSEVPAAEGQKRPKAT